MELNPAPLPPPTLTPPQKLFVPLNIPPEPSISMLFPEKPPYRAPNNPFQGPSSKKLSEEHKMALQDALESVRSPFLFDPVESYTFNGTCVEDDTPSESFNSAVITVIAAVEHGYGSNRDPAPLEPSDWARLLCTLLAAVGRGYHRQYTPDQKAALARVRAQAADPNPLLGAYPTFFHRLGATAEQVAFTLKADSSEEPIGYHDWYGVLKKDFTTKATKAAAAEVDEKWLTWKATELDRRAAADEKEIAAKTRERGAAYLNSIADRLGLQVIPKGAPTQPVQLAGLKRTVSGSTPKPAQTVPIPQATRVNPPRAAKKTPSTSPAPRGRLPLPPPAVQPERSSSPRGRQGTQPQLTTLRASPKTPPMTLGQPDAASLTVIALTKILARLDALEKKSMPPPARHPEN